MERQKKGCDAQEPHCAINASRQESAISTQCAIAEGHGERMDITGRSAGFLLAELLPAMLLSVIVFGLICNIFVTMKKTLSYQDHKLRTRKTLEACLYRILVDLRVAGCNPWGISSVKGFVPDPDEDGRANDLLIRFDRRGKGVRSFPDGDINDPDENVLYEWNGTDTVLRRDLQPMALDVVENQDKKPIFDWVDVGGNILVTVSLTMRLVGERELFTLSTKVWLRNPS